jgi:RNA recognition motif-containing protein
MRLYVGNFNYSTTEHELKELFAKQGSVIDVRIVQEQATRQSKCFGFVKMQTKSEGEKAITELHGKLINKHHIEVRKAKRV